MKPAIAPTPHLHIAPQYGAPNTHPSRQPLAGPTTQALHAWVPSRSVPFKSPQPEGRCRLQCSEALYAPPHVLDRNEAADDATHNHPSADGDHQHHANAQARAPTLLHSLCCRRRRWSWRHGRSHSSNTRQHGKKHGGHFSAGACPTACDVGFGAVSDGWHFGVLGCWAGFWRPAFKNLQPSAAAISHAAALGQGGDGTGPPSPSPHHCCSVNLVT
jgi:hypothetical protein